MNDSPVKFTKYPAGFRPKPPPPPMLRLPDREAVNLKTKFGRLRREAVIWFKAGAKLVPSEVRKARVQICKTCFYYNPMGNLGLGECGAPGCTCSRLKLAFVTSKCPHPSGPQWPPWPPSPSAT